MLTKTTQNLWLSVKRLSQEQMFFISILIVNAGNYLYNLILGGSYIGKTKTVCTPTEGVESASLHFLNVVADSYLDEVNMAFIRGYSTGVRKPFL